MSTFSQLCDSLLSEVVRPDMVQMIPGYLNQTIRELHVKADDRMPVLYADNMVEAAPTVVGAESNYGAYVWPIPGINTFQSMGAVYYPARGRYAVEKKPDVAKLTHFTDPNRECYWYRSGLNIVFSGHGGDGRAVNLTYYAYPRSLRYYPVGTRPLVYDQDEDVYVLNPNVTPVLTEEEALDRTTNWLIRRHEECLKEGVRAKCYKRMADVERARLCYSQFEGMRAGVQLSESVNLNAQYTR